MKILPPITLPPRKQICRQHTPIPGHGEKGYQKYRSCLRWEFGFTCAFCLLHESDLDEFGLAERKGLTWIEHFEPKSHTPQKVNDYKNCLYTCKYCNNARRNFPVIDCKGRKLLNPESHTWSTLFELEEDKFNVIQNNSDAEYTLEIYDLNDPIKVMHREYRRKEISAALDILTQAKVLDKQLKQHQATELIPENINLIFQNLLEKAALLIKIAYRTLERYRAIPQDATPCLCAQKSNQSLPSFIEDQIFELPTEK